MANTAFVLIFCLLVGTCSCKHIFVINSEPEPTEGDLVAVVELHRHGDRSPISSFPSDPYYNSSYWPEGYGQLLSKGVKRQYELGKWLRTRYGDFLPAEYSPNNIIVYSTDVDRTLMSAAANLAGFFPPTGSEIWEEDLLWEPIPVHLMATDDPVLAMNSDCPKFNKIQEELESLDFFRNLYTENSQLFNDLSNFTGMEVSTLDQIEMIYDVFYVYRNHNESYLPAWADDIDIEQLRYLAGVVFSKATFTDELRKLRAGPFLDFVINHFNNTINNVNDVKYLMLSAHDATISSVLGGMQVFDYHPPEFASSVIWELRSTKNDYYINILYKRNSTDAYDQITLKDCDFNCAFNDFQTNLESVSVDIPTWREACKITNNSIRVVFSWSLLLIIVLQLIA